MQIICDFKWLIREHRIEFFACVCVCVCVRARMRRNQQEKEHARVVKYIYKNVWFVGLMLMLMG